MPAILIILGALPWLLILVQQMFRRGFVVFLLWLLVAPGVMYFVDRPLNRQTLLFQTSGSTQIPIDQEGFYEEAPAMITMEKLIDPNRALITLFFVVFVLNAVLLKKTRWVPLDKIEILMTIFSLILLSNVFLSSGRLAFGLHVAVDAFIVPFMAYCLARRFVVSNNRWRQLITVIGYMGLFVVFISLVDRLMTEGLLYRVRGPFERHDNLYIAMLVVFFSTFTDLCSQIDIAYKKRALPWAIRWLLIALAPVVIMFTLTRGNWVGFFIGLAVLFFLGRRLTNFATQLGVVGSVIIPFFLVVFTAVMFLPAKLLENRVSDVPNVQGRFATWIATLELARDAPVFGIGLNNLHGELRRTKVLVGEVSNYNTAHNSFLAVLAELGGPAALTYMMMQVSIFQIGLRLYRTGRRFNDRWRGIALISIMASYNAASLFEHIIYHTTVAQIYVYVFAGAIAGLYRSQGSVPALGPAPAHRCRFASRISTLRLPTKPASRF